MSQAENCFVLFARFTLPEQNTLQFSEHFKNYLLKGKL